MIRFYTTKQIAGLWGVSSRRVAILCEQGRIESAEKIGGVWLIPPEARKPKDARIKTEGERQTEEDSNADD